MNDLPSMLDEMRADEERAIGEALPEQWDIKWGSYVIRMYENDLVIFGQVYTPGEFFAKNTEYPMDEIVQEFLGIADAYRRGYRYGRYYSEVLPEGEEGSAHVVSLWEITKEDFDKAKKLDWMLIPELALRVYNEVQLATSLQGDADESSDTADPDRDVHL